ncbi:NAD(P)-dependent oxidoreductase [Chitinasiproducens palmae]|uniref:NAD(P)-binding domain-containing protein n=1 Tax=Chitinasiproducens palmae TaxID=1770053 RepID=A0A1H2PUB9_9BURK|nr:NAD(P)-dependent oxidoreductase [Chitinasiproducens palmae]SDV50758.1 hypothetical protein SAMN05216551_11379 [Chitinasiproducens palmae]
MKIVLIGASGYVGSAVLSEALDRGHDVTAIARRPPEARADARLMHLAMDIVDTAALSAAMAGHQVAISAFNPAQDEDGARTRSIIDAAKRAKVSRLLVVGGAGSLYTASGALVIDAPDFPSEWRASAHRTAAFLDRLRGETALDWAFLSPAALLVPGERSGRYRIGKDTLLTDVNGESRISVQDYAVAMLDEVERPSHHRERFTVAY